MNSDDNSLSDVTLSDFLGAVSRAPESQLVFSYDGMTISPGYHVTEVKAASFSALDCGANPEAWSEIFVQLWDVNEGERTHMAAGKFAAIVRKVSEHVRLDDHAKLTFEVSDGLRPMQLFCAQSPLHVNGVFEVALVPRVASCKPRDRWLAANSAERSTCCAPTETSCCS